MSSARGSSEGASGMRPPGLSAMAAVTTSALSLKRRYTVARATPASLAMLSIDIRA